MRPHPSSPAPLRCQRCAHLETMTAHDQTRLTCLRGRDISGTCGWWRPRRQGLNETTAKTE